MSWESIPISIRSRYLHWRPIVTRPFVLFIWTPLAVLGVIVLLRDDFTHYRAGEYVRHFIDYLPDPIPIWVWLPFIAAGLIAVLEMSFREHRRYAVSRDTYELKVTESNDIAVNALRTNHELAVEKLNLSLERREIKIEALTARLDHSVDQLAFTHRHYGDKMEELRRLKETVPTPSIDFDFVNASNASRMFIKNIGTGDAHDVVISIIKTDVSIYELAFHPVAHLRVGDSKELLVDNSTWINDPQIYGSLVFQCINLIFDKTITKADFDVKCKGLCCDEIVKSFVMSRGPTGLTEVYPAFMQPIPKGNPVQQGPESTKPDDPPQPSTMESPGAFLAASFDNDAGESLFFA
jgi:hypothetical protein